MSFDGAGVRRRCISFLSFADGTRLTTQGVAGRALQKGGGK